MISLVEWWILSRCRGNISFFTGFRVVIYWWTIKISKGVGISKRGRIKYQYPGGNLRVLSAGRGVVYHCWSLVLKHISVFLFKFSFRNVKCYYLLFYSFPFSFLMSNVDVRKYNGSYLSCSYAPVQSNLLLSLMNRLEKINQ